MIPIEMRQDEGSTVSSPLFSAVAIAVCLRQRGLFACVVVVDDDVRGSLFSLSFSVSLPQKVRKKRTSYAGMNAWVEQGRGRETRHTDKTRQGRERQGKASAQRQILL